MEVGSAEFELDLAAFLKDGADDLNLDFLDEPTGDGFSSTPDSGSAFSIDDLEQFLMNDEGELGENIFVDEFVLDALLDSDSGSPKDHPSTAPRMAENLTIEEKGGEKKDDSVDAEDNNDDPAAKRRKRQMRNRDAALRSRERRKEYVKELEMKSKYYEAECKRLGIMLQYYVAENQALRFSMNHQKAFDASVSKQESAVLLLESLLLGSLLGFMGIIWLMLHPEPCPRALKTGLRMARSIAGEARKEPGNKLLDGLLLPFVLSKRCRGTRSRMKLGLISSTCEVGACC